MSALQRHVGPRLFPFVLANNRPLSDQEQPHWQPVAPHHSPQAGYEVIEADVVDPMIPWRHDSARLAEQVLRFWREQAGSPETVPVGVI
jgi:hypothetical protein